MPTAKRVCLLGILVFLVTVAHAQTPVTGTAPAREDLTSTAFWGELGAREFPKTRDGQDEFKLAQFCLLYGNEAKAKEILIPLCKEELSEKLSVEDYEEALYVASSTWEVDRPLANSLFDAVLKWCQTLKEGQDRDNVFFSLVEEQATCGATEAATCLASQDKGDSVGLMAAEILCWKDPITALKLVSACTEVQEATNVSEDEGEANHVGHYAYVYRVCGEFQKATDLTIAVKNKRKRAGEYARLALAYFEKGDKDTFGRFMTTACKCCDGLSGGEQVNALFDVIEVYSAAGLPMEAMAAVESLPDSERGAALVHVAEAYLKVGNKEACIATCQKILDTLAAARTPRKPIFFWGDDEVRRQAIYSLIHAGAYEKGVTLIREDLAANARKVVRDNLPVEANRGLDETYMSRIALELALAGGLKELKKWLDECDSPDQRYALCWGAVKGLNEKQEEEQKAKSKAAAQPSASAPASQPAFAR